RTVMAGLLRVARRIWCCLAPTSACANTGCHCDASARPRVRVVFPLARGRAKLVNSPNRERGHDERPPARSSEKVRSAERADARDARQAAKGRPAMQL